MDKEFSSLVGLLALVFSSKESRRFSLFLIQCLALLLYAQAAYMQFMHVISARVFMKKTLFARITFLIDFLFSLLLYTKVLLLRMLFRSVSVMCFTAVQLVRIQGVTGGTDQTSGECSLGQTIPI